MLPTPSRESTGASLLADFPVASKYRVVSAGAKWRQTWLADARRRRPRGHVWTLVSRGLRSCAHLVGIEVGLVNHAVGWQVSFA